MSTVKCVPCFLSKIKQEKMKDKMKLDPEYFEGIESLREEAVKVNATALITLIDNQLKHKVLDFSDQIEKAFSKVFCPSPRQML